MKTNLVCLLVFLFAIIVTGGCKKSEVENPITSYQKVKVYDDVFADPTNASVRIVAGNNRLFMTYGRGNIFVAGEDTFHTKLQVTDNDGNLISSDTLPTGLGMGDLLVLDDGSLLVASYYATDWTNPNIYLFHYNQNGEIISRSVLVPGYAATAGFNGFDIYNAVHVCRSVHGNPLVYGGFFDVSSVESGYLVECDLGGNEWWSKSFNGQISGCIATPDNGYLFDSYAYGLTQIGLSKANGAGDILWSKQFVTKSSATYGRQIIRATNGNYLFSFNAYEDTYTPFSMYELNGNGDSLNAISIRGNEHRYANAIIPQDDGGIFAIMNAPFFGAVSTGGVFSQINTHYAKLDADLKIKEEGNFQKETTDLVIAGCKTSNGEIACFGIVQCYQRDYYKPELIIIK